MREVRIFVSRWERVALAVELEAEEGVEVEEMGRVTGRVREEGTRGMGGSEGVGEEGVGRTSGRLRGSVVVAGVGWSGLEETAVVGLGTKGFHLKKGLRLTFFFSGVDFLSELVEPPGVSSSSSWSSSSSLELSGPVSFPGVTTSPHRTAEADRAASSRSDFSGARSFEGREEVGGGALAERRMLRRAFSAR